MQALKLSSSQALKLSSSQALTSNPAMISVAGGAFVAVLMMQLAGCGIAASAAGDAAKVTAPRVSAKSTIATMADAPCTIDAGVLLADQASYLCVPLSRLGISSTDDVIAVKLSCECSDVNILNVILMVLDPNA